MPEIWHIWVLAGLLLLILEIFTPGFVVGVFGVACLIVAPFAGAGLTISSQLLIFGIATITLLLTTRPLVLKHFYGRGFEIKTNVDALVGQSGYVTDPIDHMSGTGRVKLGGEEWRAITADESVIEPGRKVVVKGVDGNKVIVEPLM